MLGNVGRINPITSTGMTNDVVKAKPAKPSDSISISTDAEKMSQLLALQEKVAQTPDIRQDKIDEVMNKMKNPDFINDEVLSFVADRLMEIFKI